MTSELRDRLQASLGADYTVGRELGGGGMARVFVADDTGLGRKIVVKVLPAELAASVNLERFKQEIRLAARLQHPHIVPLLSTGEVDGLPFFTMPYVEGESLETRLASVGELPVTDAVRILREVASALGYAHKEGVVHRDVKPGNVLLSGGIAMVTDFGIAKALLDAKRTPNAEKLTDIGTAVGTPAYSAPEQAAADPQVDQRADIYAWGVMAYEILTGTPPFAGRTAQATLAAHVSEPPEEILRKRPRVPAALAVLVMKCLEKRPADRPQSADEIIRALDASSSTGDHTSAPVVRRNKIVLRSLIALVLLGVIAFAANRWRGGPSPSAAAASSSTRTIAVLPFASGDTAHEFFSDGITDELGMALSQVQGLQVISRRSAYAFQGKANDPRDIGKALGASLLLDGTVRREGNRVRVTSQLTNASDAIVLWSDHYEGDAKDVFALQDSIAHSIVRALKLAIGVGSAPAIAGVRTGNLEAHDLYLQGKFEASKHTREGLIAALDLFRRSSAKDPTYAPPLVGLADAYGWLADDYVPAHEAYVTATAAVRKAIAIAPDLGEAHAVLAWILSAYNWRPVAAAAEGKRAVELDPTSALAHSNYSYPLMYIGKRDEALAEMKRAVALEPLSGAFSANLEWHYVMRGEYQNAIDQHRHTIQVDPHYFFDDSWAGAANRELGRYDEALKLYVQAQSLHEGRPVPGLAMTYARMGDTARARTVLAELITMSREGFVKPEGIAQVYASLGDFKNAFVWLDKALANRSNGLLWLNQLPGYKPLRGDPRFAALVKRVAADTLP